MVKEFYHILRDSRSLMVIFILPLLMIFFYGYALSFDLGKIKLVLVNHGQNENISRFWDRLSASSAFTLMPLKLEQQFTDPLQAAEGMLRKGHVHAVLVFPENFSKNLANFQPVYVGVILDAGDANKAQLIMQRLEQFRTDFILQNQKFPDITLVHTHMLFNPESKSYHFLVPGMVAVLLMMIASMLTSISISREKESASIRLLFLSELHSLEIIIGKTLPYIVVAFLCGSLVVAFAHSFFHVPSYGSVYALAGIALLYILCGLALGILISVISATQRMANILSVLATMLPSLLLSGFIFPVESMTPLIRLFSKLIPATYFLRVIRHLFVKGADFRYFLPEVIALSLMSAGLLLLAWWSFHRLRRKTG
jgi:ABC-2 type transport system permease protein